MQCWQKIIWPHGNWLSYTPMVNDAWLVAFNFDTFWKYNKCIWIFDYFFFVISHNFLFCFCFFRQKILITFISSFLFFNLIIFNCLNFFIYLIFYFFWYILFIFFSSLCTIFPFTPFCFSTHFTIQSFTSTYNTLIFSLLFSVYFKLLFCLFHPHFFIL